MLKSDKEIKKAKMLKYMNMNCLYEFWLHNNELDILEIIHQ